MSSGAAQIASGVALSSQEIIQNFIWNSTVFLTMIAIITYVLDHFGMIRAAPVVEGNITEEVDQGFRGFGSFLKESIVEGTKLAKTINSAVNDPPSLTEAVKPDAPKVN